MMCLMISDWRYRFIEMKGDNMWAAQFDQINWKRNLSMIICLNQIIQKAKVFYPCSLGWLMINNTKIRNRRCDLQWTEWGEEIFSGSNGHLNSSSWILWAMSRSFLNTYTFPISQASSPSKWKWMNSIPWEIKSLLWSPYILIHNL